MFDQKEHQPGDRAPATAHCEELNVFGSPTGSVADVRFFHSTGTGQLYVAAHTAEVLSSNGGPKRNPARVWGPPRGEVVKRGIFKLPGRVRHICCIGIIGACHLRSSVPQNFSFKTVLFVELEAQKKKLGRAVLSYQ